MFNIPPVPTFLRGRLVLEWCEAVRNMLNGKTKTFILNGDSESGIQVDAQNPSWTWKDLPPTMLPDPGGVNAPVLTNWIGTARQYAYGANDKFEIVFHLPHDYKKGTDVDFHIHWSHNGTGITGTFGWTFVYSFGRSYNKEVFTSAKTLSDTHSTNITDYPYLAHNNDYDRQIAIAGGSSTQIDSALLEPDSIIAGTFTLTDLPTITGGTSNKIFIHRVCLHYQSTCIGTKNRTSPFYL